jgi:hypothetical protein
MNAWDWSEGTYFTTFIVGSRYVTVLHAYKAFPTVIEEVLELVGDKSKTPFAILSSICCPPDVVIDNELAELVLGV